MKKITQVVSVLSAKNVLTAEEMAYLKGGGDIIIGTATNLIIDAEKKEIIDPLRELLKDDKRRERPGGGISTL